MNSTEILDKAKKLVSKDREDKHGDKVETMKTLLDYGLAYLQNKTKLNYNILPEDVANMMALLKIARSQGGSFNLDDFVDAVGIQQ